MTSVITFKGVDGALDIPLIIADEFIKILPEGMHLYGFTNNDLYVIYISNEETVAVTGREAQAAAEAGQGYIQFVLSIGDTTVVSLATRETQRGKGIGIYLILFIAWLSEANHVRKVLLDDDSDRAGKPHNIYIKTGFVETDNYPELIGNTSEIRSKIPEFLQQYVGSDPGKFFTGRLYRFGRKYLRRRRTR